MSDYTEQKTKQLRLILSDYQSELNAIDLETTKEKAQILSAIETEELEIKSLLEQYRRIKRHKEIDEVKSSYEELTQFKQNLLLKIKSESELAAANESLSDEQFSSKRNQEFQLITTNPLQLAPESEGLAESTGTPTVIPETQPTKIELDSREEDTTVGENEAESSPSADDLTVQELIDFIDQRSAAELVKLYPADVSQIVASFDTTNTTVRDRLLQHYQQDVDVHNSLVKLYQKPDLAKVNNIPDLNSLSDKDLQYHEFLQTNYPLSLPFFWFLIDREPNSIKYVVMEFAVDHIIHTNTLSNDPNRRDLSLRLSELLEMNNNAPLADFLRDLFICFHPQRVSQKSNSRNKYFDYMDSLITTQSTLQYSDVLLMWNYMKKSGYHEVSSADFSPMPPTDENSSNGSLNLAPESDRDITL